MKDFKDKITEIETEIIAITGGDVEDYNEWAENANNRSRVESLLKQRCELLNDMYQCTAENLERFSQINNHLTDLTTQAYDRISDVDYFVDNYMIEYENEDRDLESWIRFIYQGEESVLKLDDDEYYGSNFVLIIKVLTELYIAKCQENIIYARIDKHNPDDGRSWIDKPLLNWKDILNKIIICYAVHDLTSHKAYSVPDLLRLNSFVCESTITFQSITQQNGTRFGPDKKTRTPHIKL
ncbi:MAG: hypothetical protein K2M04_04200 [Muribaculaceae bacterium]|nr:hypothetical protein [Muribaculaceae bacterium]